VVLTSPQPRPRVTERRHGHPSARRRFDSELVVAAAEVLNEGMPGDADPDPSVLLEATHRP
jgi:hypothetical protein